MKRREVLQVSAATVVLGLLDCGSSDPGKDGGTASTCTTSGIKSMPIDDPKHSFTAPAADVTAGATKTYSIQGTSTHDHTITLTTGHFDQLKAGMNVSVMSTNTLGHQHTVSVTCA
jgi:hypothetical protein